MYSPQLQALLEKIKNNPCATPFTSVESLVHELTDIPCTPRQMVQRALRYTSESDTTLNDAVLFGVSIIWLDQTTTCDKALVFELEKDWNHNSNARYFLSAMEKHLTDDVAHDRLVLTSAAFLLMVKDQLGRKLSVKQAIAQLNQFDGSRE